jgi:DNA/RNA endonuclease YhcR with UshA esterase domain
LKGKKVCITGQVIDYKGKPEIVITDTLQIKLQ